MAFAVHALRKSYGGVEVLKGVDLVVADGEIHALLGANGAGKSTLIKCLSGAIPPDSGVMMVGDRRYAVLTPKTAKAAGVSVIYQDLSLALSLDVTDNMFLGKELRFGPFIRKRAQRIEAARWLAELGADISPTASLGRLGNAELQTIEIAKALRSRPRVLILDEPTAALSEREAEALGKQLLTLKNQRLPVLYVTHRLGEVFALADRATVLRGGEVVLTGEVGRLNRAQLVDAIAGTRVDTTRRVAVAAHAAQLPPLLEVSTLLGPGIGPVSFSVSAGEVVGVFGIVGSGRTELVETLFGVRPRFGGEIRVNGASIGGNRAVAALAAGLALVPADRLRKSVLGTLSAGNNVLLASYRLIARGGVRRFGREAGVFARATASLHLQPPRMDLEARRFSGGNQQKLVIARWLNETRACRLLLLDEPTQGVDVGARSDIYDALRATARAGRAVLFTSSEPEELVQIADRVIVLSGGRIAAVLRGAEIEEARLLSLAHQFEQHEGHAA
jgi:ribose transport system ATP-binding protein